MKKAKKRILFITGTRADYGKIKPLMNAVEGSGLWELYIFVTGMHLLDLYGSTYSEIQKDGYKNIYIAHGLAQTGRMSENLGNTINHLSGYIASFGPDMIVVHGDRLDALAGAIVGALNNITVAHIEGGEVSGTIDESIRHAISKFAHLHFVSNDEAKARVMQLGEHPENIFVIGSPDIDVMLSDSLPSLYEAKLRYDISFDSYSILLYHPVTTEHDSMAEKIDAVIGAILGSKKKYLVIYPNNDLGSEIILDRYSRLKGNRNLVIHPSIRFEHFLTLLKHADFIIGNSSAGIREAEIYGVPAINIGSRQNGRFRSKRQPNIQHVDEVEKKIAAAIKRVPARGKSHMNFGKGDSAQRFIEIISEPAIWHRKLQKRFVDLKEI